MPGRRVPAATSAALPLTLSHCLVPAPTAAADHSRSWLAQHSQCLQHSHSFVFRGVSKALAAVKHRTPSISTPGPGKLAICPVHVSGISANTLIIDRWFLQWWAAAAAASCWSFWDCYCSVQRQLERCSKTDKLWCKASQKLFRYACYWGTPSTATHRCVCRCRCLADTAVTGAGSSSCPAHALHGPQYLPEVQL